MRAIVCTQTSVGFSFLVDAASAAFLRLMQTMAIQPAGYRINYQVEACFDGFSGHCSKPLLGTLKLVDIF